jgi:hypothetical protein
VYETAQLTLPPPAPTAIHPELIIAGMRATASPPPALSFAMFTLAVTLAARDRAALATWPLPEALLPVLDALVAGVHLAHEPASPMSPAPPSPPGRADRLSIALAPLPVADSAPPSSAELQAVFRSYAAQGDRAAASWLGAAGFQRLCRDTGIVDGVTSPLDVDLVFIEAQRLRHGSTGECSARALVLVLIGVGGSTQIGENGFRSVHAGAAFAGGGQVPHCGGSRYVCLCPYVLVGSDTGRSERLSAIMDALLTSRAPTPPVLSPLHSASPLYDASEARVRYRSPSRGQRDDSAPDAALAIATDADAVTAVCQRYQPVLSWV